MQRTQECRHWTVVSRRRGWLVFVIVTQTKVTWGEGVEAVPSSDWPAVMPVGHGFDQWSVQEGPAHKLSNGREQASLQHSSVVLASAPGWIPGLASFNRLRCVSQKYLFVPQASFGHAFLITVESKLGCALRILRTRPLRSLSVVNSLRGHHWAQTRIPGKPIRSWPETAHWGDLVSRKAQGQTHCSAQKCRVGSEGTRPSPSPLL